jgi:glutamate-ammonia-ligase adenylyltransferase
MQVPQEQTFDAAIRALPESLRDTASNWVDRLIALQPDAQSSFVLASGDIRGLIRVVTCSEFAGNVAINQWQWLCSCSSSQAFAKPPSKKILQKRFDAVLSNEIDIDSFKRSIRALRNQTLFAILWRDLVLECELSESISALSDLADCAINAATEFASIEHRKRFGVIPFGNGDMPIVVLSMGKLGGHELNFSSDIDIIFLYPSNGESDGKRSLSAHEYFARYARQVVKLLEEGTTDGFVYRVDTRLRPFGNSGPPVVIF